MTSGSSYHSRAIVSTAGRASGRIGLPQLQRRALSAVTRVVCDTGAPVSEKGALIALSYR